MNECFRLIPNSIPCIQRYVANLCDREVYVDNNQENVVYISSNNNNNFL